MKSSRNGFKVLLTTVCIILVLALITSGNKAVNGFLTGYVLTPLQRVAADVTGNAEGSVKSPGDAKELDEENKRLKEENRRLNDMLVEYYETKRENEELYKFYDIKKKNNDFSLVPSKVISRDPNENFYGFVLDKGSNDGISLNDPVMTEYGLAGYVCEVSLKTCKVTPLLSPDASVSAVDKRTGDEGVIAGEAEYSEKGSIILKNISTDNTVKVGDIIVTSGYGGMYPRNIKIGTVSSLAYDYAGMPVAVVSPFEDVTKTVSAVIVVDFSGKGEINEYSGEESSKS